MIKINCTSCRHTGLYSGFAEPKETAVICSSCKGRGYVEKDGGDVTPNELVTHQFNGRHKKEGITKVWFRNAAWGNTSARDRCEISASEFYSMSIEDLLVKHAL